MVKKKMMIVGKKILVEPLKKLHYSPSLWYKSSVKAISSDLVRTEAEQVSLDTTGRSCNHGDSCAQNATTEHSVGPLSTKVCGALPTDMVPKGSDYPAPTGVPETSSSAGAKCLGSQGMEGEGRDSPMQNMSLGNSVAQPARYQDPNVTRMPPIICDDPLRISPGISGFPGVKVCNSAPTIIGPPACASLAPTNASKTHEILVPGSTPSPKGRESIVPILVLGNSESAGIKRLNSTPRMTPEGQEFLSRGIASQSPVLHPVKRPGASSSAARPPIYPPGRGKSPYVSTGVRDSLSLSITPKRRYPPVPTAEPKQQGSPAADSTPTSNRPPQAMDAATKVHNAPTPITRERKGQAVAQNKLPRTGLDGCSHVETLIALSTPREKGER
ncbi:uncharacterized protein LOC8082595 [Sorghum bicolor]|uniref:Uncharacterized protein n=1 Tax=Sorghum bicolor TaxID=4558 RepID=A0A1Z5RFM4_SORBI|nr:uncharacterized protein LOC8082595 [Sorghum bicolor]XP_021319578.1 uncharacterized protein LOC8082595 [Sorghum bicolor]XP_021319579.1 uncharacterized protein LOC8082595 [Sorghum bicolor]XP_021319580.1 uncharacterized protein LOC8082595 [Sorghum bicolor]XP_021319581.1 uncharacterized protein LOC8082595 [Sorghum bicolor]OQU82552.1 hypothetical protein SORBI_3006G262501 [Sorghum bicolor]|eukprot:XP_021319577.1 uncharacterized protein LOC8082595 [Sorghum bicolor]